MSFCDDPKGYHEHGCPGYALERIADALEALMAAKQPQPEPEHADDIEDRIIGYTAFECERDMRRMTDGARGCANPEEHAS